MGTVFGGFNRRNVKLMSLLKRVHFVFLIVFSVLGFIHLWIHLYTEVAIKGFYVKAKLNC